MREYLNGIGWLEMAAQDRELAALSSDKQTLMSAVTHWREQVEGLRRRQSTVAASLRAGAYMDGFNGPDGFASADDAIAWAIQELDPPAATRPVPTSTRRDESVCKNCAGVILFETVTIPRWIHMKSGTVTCRPRLPMVDTSEWFEKNAAVPAAPGDGASPPDAHTNEEK